MLTMTKGCHRTQRVEKGSDRTVLLRFILEEMKIMAKWSRKKFKHEEPCVVQSCVQLYVHSSIIQFSITSSTLIVCLVRVIVLLILTHIETKKMIQTPLI